MNCASPGNTPLIEVDGIFAKLECTNPCGSIKDRVANYIVAQSEAKGLLRPGMRVVEATSGNTGIAFAYYARQRGYDVTIVMPEDMTDERKRLIRDLGAELILCSAGDFAEAARIRDELAEKNGWFNPDQFSNPLNVACHRETTAREVLAQLEGRQVDAVVAGVGTGGTLIGLAQAFLAVNPDLEVVAVEPLESAVMTGGSPGSHGIQGIGDGFVPAIAGNGNGGLHPLIDGVSVVSTEDALAAAHLLEETHGYCVGVSSGANYTAARRLLERHETVVTVFADGYLKYQSQGLRHCGAGGCQYESFRVSALPL